MGLHSDRSAIPGVCSRCVKYVSPPYEGSGTIIQPEGAPPPMLSSRKGKKGFFDLSEAAHTEASMEEEKRCCEDNKCNNGVEKEAPPMSHVALGVEDRTAAEFFPAHRMVLSLRSQPMRAMFHSGMRETLSVEVLVKDIRPPVFEALLTYLYTDTLQMQQPEDIMELLVVANQYTLDGLTSLCEGFLQGVIDEDNAATLYHYADALGMTTFEHRVLTFILQRWRNVTRSEAWTRLPCELHDRIVHFRRRGTHIFMVLLEAYPLPNNRIASSNHVKGCLAASSSSAKYKDVQIGSAARELRGSHGWNKKNSGKEDDDKQLTGEEGGSTEEGSGYYTPRSSMSSAEFEDARDWEDPE
ncbi:unnamed protein product [Choristocarpus tenellus]